jgi:TRAP transporter TAXI family solute receptor
MSSINRNWLRAGAAVLLAPALLLSACGSPDTSGDSGAGADGSGGTLSIATGGTGGVYYPLGGGFATVIRENIDGYDATVQETNASVDNVLLIANGSAQIAFSVGDVVSDAVEGVGEFEGKPQDICSLGNIYNNYLQAVTVDGTGITTAEQLEGKVVSVGAPGSATEVGALRILEAAGVDPDSVERRQLGVAETVAALRDGTIDAGFWSGGLPIGQYAETMADSYGEYYLAEEIPAKTYEGQTEAVQAIASPNLLIASPKMDEQLQQDIAAALFDNVEELEKVHPSAKEMDASTAGDVSYVDTCPGAKTYFDQAGS